MKKSEQKGKNVTKQAERENLRIISIGGDGFIRVRTLKKECGRKGCLCAPGKKSDRRHR